MGAVRATLTMEEFLALPELAAGKRELLRGELIELPPAKFKHDEIAHRVYERLKIAVAAAGIGGAVYHEVGYQMGLGHWLKPDVSITHRDQAVAEYLLGAPQLAVEIVSASNTADEIEAKIEDYHLYGAKEVWVLYPERRHLWVYAAEISAQRHSGSFVSQLLNGEVLDLDAIFAD
jgi:Uma2 family endonuclease